MSVKPTYGSPNRQKDPQPPNPFLPLVPRFGRCEFTIKPPPPPSVAAGYPASQLLLFFFFLRIMIASHQPFFRSKILHPLSFYPPLGGKNRTLVPLRFCTKSPSFSPSPMDQCFRSSSRANPAILSWSFSIEDLLRSVVQFPYSHASYSFFPLSSTL